MRVRTCVLFGCSRLVLVEVVCAVCRETRSWSWYVRISLPFRWGIEGEVASTRLYTVVMDSCISTTVKTVRRHRLKGNTAARSQRTLRKNDLLRSKTSTVKEWNSNKHRFHVLQTGPNNARVLGRPYFPLSTLPQCSVSPVGQRLPFRTICVIPPQIAIAIIPPAVCDVCTR